MNTNFRDHVLEFFSVAAVTTPLPMLLLLLPMLLLLLLLLPEPPPWRELQLLLPPYVCICV